MGEKHERNSCSLQPPSEQNQSGQFLLTNSPKQGLGEHPMTVSSQATIQPLPEQAIERMDQPDKSVMGFGYMLASLAEVYWNEKVEKKLNLTDCREGAVASKVVKPTNSISLKGLFLHTVQKIKQHRKLNC